MRLSSRWKAEGQEQGGQPGSSVSADGRWDQVSDRGRGFAERTGGSVWGSWQSRLLHWGWSISSLVLIEPVIDFSEVLNATSPSNLVAKLVS